MHGEGYFGGVLEVGEDFSGACFVGRTKVENCGESRGADGDGHLLGYLLGRWFLRMCLYP